MQKEFVHLLDARGRFARHDEVDLGDPFARAAFAPKQSDRPEFTGFSLFQRSPDVGAFSTRGDRNQEVTGLCERRHLPRKDFLEPIIVSGGSQKAAALR